MATPQNLACPECGAPMVSRLTKPTRDLFGASQRRFWGCSRYPECRGTRDTDGLSKAERADERKQMSEVWGKAR